MVGRWSARVVEPRRCGGIGTGGFNLVCLTGKQYVNKWQDVSGQGHEDPELITPSGCLFSRLQMHLMPIFTSALPLFLFIYNLLIVLRLSLERQRELLSLILHFLD